MSMHGATNTELHCPVERRAQPEIEYAAAKTSKDDAPRRERNREMILEAGTFQKKKRKKKK
jgi:hypothetical protein